MGHGADDRNNATPRERLDAAGATDVAATLQALATPSRLYILARLQEGPCSVGDLERKVVASHHATDFADGASRVAGLTRADGPSQPVPGHGNKVPENCARRR